MLWDRERYISHVLFHDTGREMFSELFGPLHRLEKEWRAAGATEKEINMTAFDFDYVKTVWLPASTGAVTGIKPYVISDDENETLAVDKMGRHTRLVKSSATIALPLDHPISSAAELEKVAPWYAFSENRINKEKLLSQKKARDEGGFTMIGFPGAFDEMRELLGEVEVCCAYYEEPEAVRDMLSLFADTAVKCIERVGEVVPIDCVFVHEDMAGKAGPMVGPNIVREFYLPYYKKVFDAARAYGARVFSMDSDGDVSPLFPELIESGLNCIHPCEPVGGMDMEKLRAKYGNKICLKGGINKFALLGTKDDIRAELEKRIVPSLLGGGTVFGLDHRIPNGVPIENYRYYVKAAREMLGLPPISGEGWGRMAF